MRGAREIDPSVEFIESTAEGLRTSRTEAYSFGVSGFASSVLDQGGEP